MQSEDLLTTAEAVMKLMDKEIILEALATARKNQSLERITIKSKILGGEFEATLVFDERPKAPVKNSEQEGRN